MENVTQQGKSKSNHSVSIHINLTPVDEKSSLDEDSEGRYAS